jgi:MFS family permease
MAEATARPGFYGWKNVSALFFIYMFTLGMMFYGYSAIFPEMVKEMGWNRGTASIAHTLNMLLSGLLIPLTAVFINRIGTRNTIRIGLGFLLLCGLSLGTLTTQMWQWILLWGIAGGIGFAFAGLVSVQTPLMYWFNVNRAMAIGLVMTGAPAGGFLAQPFYTWLIDRTQTWTIGWISGSVFVLAAFGLSFLIVDKPSDIGQHPDGMDPEKGLSPGKGKGKQVRTFRTKKTWMLGEVMRTPVFWLTVVFWISHVMPVILITSHGVLHFTDIGYNKMQAAAILSVLIMASSISRFPVGWLGDRIEPRRIITVSLGVMVLAYVGLWRLTDLKLMIVAGFIFGLCHGAQLIMFPTMIGNYFGPDRFAAINGAISPLSIGFSALVPMGGGFIFEKTGSYNSGFIMLIVVLFVGFCVSFFLLPPVRDRFSDPHDKNEDSGQR